MSASRRIAFIGAGAVVSDMYGPATSSVPGLEIVGVCDLDAERASRVAADLRAPMRTADDAIARAGLVIVAVPPAAHFAVARQALEGGCDVLCEKPFVCTEDEASQLIALARDRERKLFVGHFRRLLAPVRLARKLLGSGILGAPQAIEAIEGGRFSWHAKSEYTTSDPFGGALFDTGSHLLDAALFVTGWDELDFDVRVGDVEREPASEPSHAIEGRLELSIDGRQLDLAFKLSRYEMLANVIRVRCERGTLELPAGPGSHLRIRGPAGTVTIPAVDGQLSTPAAFIQQLRSVVIDRDVPDLAGDRFVGVTRVLQAALGEVIAT
ncbi:MAG: Gfo/Idh/MocA family oxidoreductase [Solirubrobacteraceae bacterium]